MVTLDPLPDLTRAALDAARKWDRDDHVIAQNRIIQQKDDELKAAQQELQQMTIKMSELYNEYRHMGEIMTGEGIEW